MTNIDRDTNIDRVFWDMTKNLTSYINFPQEAVDIPEFKSFLFKYGKRLFVLPEYYYKLSATGAESSLLKWRQYSYLNQKRIIMDLFLDELAYRCWFKVDNLRYLLMLSDLLLADEMEYYRHNLGPDQKKYYRDHVLHAGYVFIWGLWMYINHRHILEDLFKQFLDNNPISNKGSGEYFNGCRALTRVNVDCGWQFFQQWFLTSAFHDIGYFLEDIETRKTPRFKIRMLKHINYFGKRFLGNNYDNYEVKIDDRNTLHLNLHAIKYPYHHAEDYIPDNMWEECLDEVRCTRWSNDHGIYSAALFLKIGNILTKYLQLRDENTSPETERDPWKRYSYRNYIIPAAAISKHNNIENQAKGAKYVKLIDGQNLIVEVSIDDFRKDFLSTMLVASDAIASFDRIGGREPLLGIQYNIRKVEDRDNIKFVIFRIKPQSN